MKKNNCVISIAVPAANGKPMVKGFKGVLYFNDKLMEFRIVEDIVSHCEYNYDMWFETTIKTPIGLMALLWNEGRNTVLIDSVSKKKKEWQTTNIYMSANDVLFENPADMKLKVYSTQISVPAETINQHIETQHLGKMNLIECYGYIVEDDVIKRVLHCIETFKINEDCDIYDYDCGMEEWIPDLETASKILLANNMNIMRLKD